MENQTLAGLYTETFQTFWDKPVFNDFQGEVFSFSDVAQSITTLAYIFEKAGVQRGDKIALYGRNSTNWAKVFLACLAYGAVAVPVLPDFVPENVEHILEHSDSKFLFAATNLYQGLNKDNIQFLSGCICLDDFSILDCKNDNLKALSEEGLEKMHGEKISKENFKFIDRDEDEMVVLSYTSGSSGFSKGVMVPARSLYSNIKFAIDYMPLKQGDRIVSFLPMSHIFGLAFEFLFPITQGCHTTILTKTPSPATLVQAYKEIQPHLIFQVPLVIEKIYKKRLLPTLQKPIMKVLLAVPGINSILHKKIKAKLIDTFGGRFFQIVVGGAALSAEVETFFRKIKFPFTIGYGMTECGPLISYSRWDVIKPLSAGVLVDRMQVRIDSEDPFKTVGEIQVKGTNVMLGYYKNDEANRNTFTDDGWLKTGDLGILDADNTVFIRGRSKNMLLGPSGQNIYPEELEARLMNMAYVAECVVIQRDAKLVALVYADKDAMKADGVDAAGLEAAMADNRKHFNSAVAAYEQLTKIELVKEEFEKTPKKNVKRYLYT